MTEEEVAKYLNALAGALDFVCVNLARVVAESQRQNALVAALVARAGAAPPPPAPVPAPPPSAPAPRNGHATQKEVEARLAAARAAKAATGGAEVRDEDLPGD